MVCFSYGTAPSPRHQSSNRSFLSISELQERAKHLLNAPPDVSSENATLLLQLIEDFCREGDKFVEVGKRDKDDLQAEVCFIKKYYFCMSRFFFFLKTY